MKLFLIALFITLSFTAPTYSQDAKKTFETLKTLEGEWQGLMHTTPVEPEVDGSATKVTFRVTSMGNLLMHEMTGAGRPDDPITTIYLDSDRLTLTHYCDAGNRPRMIATSSPDGRQVEFEFADVAGSTTYGYMHRAAFNLIDADHHTEEWTYMMPGEKPIRARVELTRTRAANKATIPNQPHKH
jgi:hypothetical protein